MTSANAAFYDYWRQWFTQSAEAKEPYRRIKNAAVNKGNWYPPFTEAPGYGKPDPKEYFHWGTKDQYGTFLSGAAQQATANVFWGCYRAATNWCRERGLDAVNAVVTPELCVLRILHYLPTPDGLAGEAHRDYDLLTVNVGGTCPGLEVLEAAPGAVPQSAPPWTPREGGVHVGEMLEIWDRASPVGSARDALNATPHRVRIPPNTERYAAVFFYLPPMDFELRPGLTAKQYLADVMGRAGTVKGAK